MLGQLLGHYRILELIGAGGMGVVYRAHDERLDRDVALKVLPPGTLADEAARKRFRKEALALAKLNHPHIDAVYDFDNQDGTDFLVMEFIPGVTLSERLTAGSLPDKEILRLGTQLAEGLAAAHEQGIVHRDLKPGNLRILPDGRLKILDFGLAELVPARADAQVTDSITETKAVAGTLPYMAPEQLRGDTVDARTDIFAMGVVLYEMATGRLPYYERLSTALADDILHRSPPPPSRITPELSARLEEIILKCLEKDPANRYQSAKELLVDLRRLSLPESVVPVVERPKFVKRRAIAVWASVAAVVILAAGAYFLRGRMWPAAKPPAGKIMLVVLPFENLSGDPEQEFFSDGLTEEMISQLGSLQPKRLGVIARTSAMRYKKTEKGVDQIGRELNVAYVLEGSVRKAGTRVRVTAQLIQVSDQTHLWAENYEKELADVLSVQSEVAHRIAKSLEIELLPPQQARLAAIRSVNPEALEAYLKGRYHWNRRTTNDLLKSAEYFQAATRADPTYALAYAGLGDAYALYPFYGVRLARDAFPDARAAAARALEIDSTLAEAQTTMAFVTFYYDWDWGAAEAQLKHILEVRPDYGIARQWYAEYLGQMGRPEEAIRESKRAQESDPLSPQIRVMECYAYYWGGRHDDAIRACRSTIAFDPQFVNAHLTLGRAFLAKGLFEDAEKAIQTSDELGGFSTSRSLDLALLYARWGRYNDARKILEAVMKDTREKQQLVATRIGLVYAALGERDAAITWMETAFQVRDVQLIRAKVDARYDTLRSAPRFQDLLRRMNFPQ